MILANTLTYYFTTKITGVKSFKAYLHEGPISH